jgi:hypothetical protein
MAALLADTGMWDERRAVARAFVEQAHDWASNVRRYDPVYQTLLTRRQAISGAAA